MSRKFSTHHPGDLPPDCDDAGLDVGAVAEAAAADEGEPDVAQNLLEGEVPEVSLEALSGSPGDPVFVNDVGTKERIIDRLEKESFKMRIIGREQKVYGLKAALFESNKSLAFQAAERGSNPGD